MSFVETATGNYCHDGAMEIPDVTQLRHTPLARRVLGLCVVGAVVMSLGAQTAMAQDGRRRAGAAERIGLESLGAGVGMLGAGLVGVLTGLATSNDGSRSMSFDFDVELGYMIGMHVALGVGLILAPILAANFGAQTDRVSRVSWLYGLLGAVVLGGSGYAIAFAASDNWYFQPSGWVIAPAAGILLGAVLGLELGVAVAPDAADDDQPVRAALQLMPSVQMDQRSLMLGVDGRF